MIQIECCEVLMYNADFYGLTMSHEVLIDAVVDDFLEQNVNPIIGTGAIAQLADVHPWPEPDVLLPIKRPDVALSITLFPLVCHAVVPVKPM